MRIWRVAPDGLPEKRCSACEKRGRMPWHRFDAFDRARSQEQSISSRCKVCLSEDRIAWADAHPGYHAARRAVSQAKQRDVRRIPITVDTIAYPSITAAARVLGVHISTLVRRKSRRGSYDTPACKKKEKV